MTTLHYIYDPLCGWCYGAAPLIKIAREIIPVRAHGGGMMTGAHRQSVTRRLRSFVMQHDEQIAKLTGQPFGDAYFNGLLYDTTAVFDSEPPIAAMLAAEQVADRALDMIAQLQVAHYVVGRRISDRTVLLESADAIGLDAKAFAESLDRQTGEVVQTHIRQTRQLMHTAGASGFPAFILESDGSRRLLDITPYLGHPKDFADWLATNGTLPGVAGSTQRGCDTDGCII